MLIAEVEQICREFDGFFFGGIIYNPNYIIFRQHEFGNPREIIKIMRFDIACDNIHAVFPQNIGKSLLCFRRGLGGIFQSVCGAERHLDGVLYTQ